MPIALVVGILAAAFALRVWGLGTLPDGLFRDEAARGYDAYSLLKTGRGAFGDGPMPMLFQQHFGLAWVEGLYNYLTVPWVAIFGLTVFATRLTAALAGTATVGATYLLGTEWHGRAAGLVAAALAALSPWHLVFSRIAFRGILLPLATTLGLYLAYSGLRRASGWRLIASGAAFGLALHTYSVSRLFIPLALLVVLLSQRRRIVELLRTDPRARRRIVAGVVVFIAMAAPIYYLSFFGPANARFRLISVFSEPHPVRLAASNYLRHISADFLFLEGDANPRHGVPDFGQMLVVLAPLVWLAAFLAAFGRIARPRRAAALFLAGCLPPALTTDGIPHALRAIGAFPFLEIATAVAIVWLVRRAWQARRALGRLAGGALAAAILCNAAFFLTAYFGPYRAVSRPAFDYGMQEAIAYTETDCAETPLVVLSDRIPLGYIFPLFFARLDPRPFQAERSLGRYIAGEARQARLMIQPEAAVYIVTPPELPRAIPRRLVDDPEGRLYLKIVE